MRQATSSFSVARARIPENFGLFYDRHVGAVLAFCVRRTGCAETAADLTAEVFAGAHAARSRFQDTGAPAEARLYGIAPLQLHMSTTAIASDVPSSRSATKQRAVLPANASTKPIATLRTSPFV